MVSRRAARRVSVALACLLSIWPPVSGHADETGQQLLLEVSINGHPIMLIGQFEQRNGAMFAPVAQLRGLGLNVVGVDPDAVVPLSGLPGLTYEYNERIQTIDMRIGDEGRIPAEINLRPVRKPVTADSGWGAVFSYDLLADYFQAIESNASQRLAGSGEVRLFTPFAVATNTMLGSGGNDGETSFVRLESRVTVDDPDRTQSYRLGDIINGGLSWTRPVRAGGVQVATNFALRPDIVTFPVPEIAGTSAAPATLDIYVDSVRRATVPVEPGPFQVDGLPVMNGANEVSLVVRDALGREVVTTLPIYSSTQLLDDGLSEFSAEAGFLRQEFGTSSGSYGDGFLSGTARYGVTEWATVEAHGEAASEVQLFGAGAATKVSTIGLFRAAVSASQSDLGAGALANVGFEHQSGPFSLISEILKSTANYSDIASVNGDEIPDLTSRFSFSWSPERWGSFSLGYTRIDDRSIDEAQIVSASYSTPFFRSGAQLSIAGFADAITGSYSVGASLFIPLGERLYGTTSVRGGSDEGITARADVTRPAPVDDGFGYRVSLSQGDFTQRDAVLSWDNRTVDLQAAVTQGDNGYGARIAASGSVATLGGGVWLSDRINDGFAVVEVGNFKGVEVLRENRPIGRTDASGRLFLNDVRSYDGNNLAINPLDLPIDANLETTRKMVAPRGGSGMIVRFGATQTVTALLTITLPDGSYPAPGSNVTVDGGGIFVLGFDGQAYLTDLSASNRAVVSWLDGECVIEFLTAVETGQIQTIPVTCK